jgi:hypothetical protein
VPLDELHRVEDGVAVLADLVDRHDVGVVQPRRLGLAPEPLQEPCVARGVQRQHLQRYAPAQRHLLDLIHDAHATAADLAHDAVVAQEFGEPRAGRRRGRWGYAVGFSAHRQFVEQRVDRIGFGGTLAHRTYC